MENNFDVTVIMTNYNQEKYLKTAIESVLSQNTQFNYQLIITDDFSTKDNSRDIIKRYVEEYPTKIKALFNTENVGCLQNTLRAKSITKTDYFCLLDADDYWTDKYYIQNAVTFLESHPDFTIYARNVICKNEDGSEYLFIDKNIPISDFTIENYIDNICPISQTAGTFFRNIIFKNGIPNIMQDAVSTISERTFEGDSARYMMHLKYGKSHYEPTPVGVYRNHKDGIWSKMSNFEKALVNAQYYTDIDNYYDKRYHEFFILNIYKIFQQVINEIEDLSFENFQISKYYSELFFSILKNCIENKEIILADKKNKIKNLNLKYKIMFYIESHLRRKLHKKSII